MNFIKSIYNYFTNILFKEPEHIETTEEYTIINHVYEADIIHYFFINTANIYNASELMIERLYNQFYNKPIKIYLLKTDNIKPLFYNDYILANDRNIKKISKSINKHRRHLHTFVDAIDSFIEYNSIRKYSIFY